MSSKICFDDIRRLLPAGLHRRPFGSAPGYLEGGKFFLRFTIQKYLRLDAGLMEKDAWKQVSGKSRLI
jgi:hypothetical protein